MKVEDKVYKDWATKPSIVEPEDHLRSKAISGAVP